ncbi:protein of unknown function [Tenacibaculum sp. 190524A02b]
MLIYLDISIFGLFEPKKNLINTIEAIILEIIPRTNETIICSVILIF